MTFKIVPGSHLDHGLSKAQIEWLKETFASRDGFFIESVEMPETLGTVPCGLYGPAAGDEPLRDSEVFLAKRGDRPYASRMIDKPMRPTRTVTVIAGPDGDEKCVLYTAFGGGQAPREPGDKSLSAEEKVESEGFWAEHALSSQ